MKARDYMTKEGERAKARDYITEEGEQAKAHESNIEAIKQTND